MENATLPQPLDTLMRQLGLTNAHLVEASTEQLSFKMVQKGRKGRRLTTNIQDKILNALLKAKPDLKVRRRDLFRYEMEAPAVAKIHEALSLISAKKIRYPKFVDLLDEAGVTRYSVDVAAGCVTFFAPGGEAHEVRGPVVSQAAPGRFGEAALRAAIADAQKEAIDHFTFLKRIYDAGIATYEANIHERRIVYKGLQQSHRENIPLSTAEAEMAAPKKAVKKEASKKPAKSSKKKKPGIVRTTRKARLMKRKLFFKKRKNARPRKKSKK